MDRLLMQIGRIQDGRFVNYFEQTALPIIIGVALAVSAIPWRKRDVM